MNPIAKLKLFHRLSKATDEIEEGVKMKNVTKIMAGVVAIATALLQVPAFNQALVDLLKGHPNAVPLVAGISALLALIHNPQSDK